MKEKKYKSIGALEIYLRDIKDIPILTAEEEIELGNRIKNNDAQAREKMITSNQRLVIYIAKKYLRSRIPLVDLIGEGNLGLMKAVDKFNPEKGFRLSTYAVWWIEQKIRLAIAQQGGSVKLPAGINDMLIKWMKVKEQLTQKLNHVPMDEEIAKKAEISKERIKEINLWLSMTTMSSLEAPTGDEEANTLRNYTEDQSVVPPDEALEKKLGEEERYEKFDKLPERTKKVLSFRYGLKDGVKHTLKETAKHFKVTEWRIKKIEIDAEHRIKYNRFSEEGIRTKQCKSKSEEEVASARSSSVSLRDASTALTCNRKYEEDANFIINQQRNECIVCNSQLVKDAIAMGIRGIDCPFCGYYQIGGSHEKKEGKLKFSLSSPGYYNETFQHIHDNTPSLRKIFQKNLVPMGKQNEILQILVRGYRNKLSEEDVVYNKSQYRKRLMMDPYKLKSLLTILLNNKEGVATIKDAEKDSCLRIIDSAISLWITSEKYNKHNYDLVKKESIVKLKNNPKNLKAYTVLIKDLVALLNPLLLKEKDKWRPRSLKKENTFQLVSELLNCIFPHLGFTPEQTKARFHK